MTTGERWLPIRGYEGLYEVSENGLIRSLATGRPISQFTTAKGYKLARIWCDGKARTVRVHRVVLDSFARPPLEGEVTRHLNGKPGDNRIKNLAWGTFSQNERDKVRHGTRPLRTHCPRNHSYEEHSRVYVRPSPDGKSQWTTRSCTACRREIRAEKMQAKAS